MLVPGASWALVALFSIYPVLYPVESHTPIVVLLSFSAELDPPHFSVFLIVFWLPLIRINNTRRPTGNPDSPVYQTFIEWCHFDLFKCTHVPPIYLYSFRRLLLSSTFYRLAACLFDGKKREYSAVSLFFLHPEKEDNLCSLKCGARRALCSCYDTAMQKIWR